MPHGYRSACQLKAAVCAALICRWQSCSPCFADKTFSEFRGSVPAMAGLHLDIPQPPETLHRVIPVNSEQKQQPRRWLLRPRPFPSRCRGQSIFASSPSKACAYGLCREMQVAAPQRQSKAQPYGQHGQALSAGVLQALHGKTEHCFERWPTFSRRALSLGPPMGAP